MTTAPTHPANSSEGEAVTAQEQFIAALDYALDKVRGDGAMDFLWDWRNGDTSEWPDFKAPAPLHDNGQTTHPSPVLTEGDWVTVPREPTLEQLDAMPALPAIVMGDPLAKQLRPAQYQNRVRYLAALAAAPRPLPAAPDSAGEATQAIDAYADQYERAGADTSFIAGIRAASRLVRALPLSADSREGSEPWKSLAAMEGRRSAVAFSALKRIAEFPSQGRNEAGMAYDAAWAVSHIHTIAKEVLAALVPAALKPATGGEPAITDAMVKKAAEVYGSAVQALLRGSIDGTTLQHLGQSAMRHALTAALRTETAPVGVGEGIAAIVAGPMIDGSTNFAWLDAIEAMVLSLSNPFPGGVSIAGGIDEWRRIMGKALSAALSASEPHADEVGK